MDKKMKVHNLKLSEHYAEAVLCGEKNFEVRYNDRGYQKGDFVSFIVVEGGLNVKAVVQPFEHKLYEITYVHSGLGLKEGYVVFGIVPAEVPDERVKPV